jgi:hypothetical protein
MKSPIDCGAKREPAGHRRSRETTELALILAAQRQSVKVLATGGEP